MAILITIIIIIIILSSLLLLMWLHNIVLNYWVFCSPTVKPKQEASDRKYFSGNMHCSKKGSFCSSLMSVRMSNCSGKCVSFLDIDPKAPITMGITLKFAAEHLHILDISTLLGPVYMEASQPGCPGWLVYPRSDRTISYIVNQTCLYMD